ncbi:hypothetical protein J8J14_14630 [Roseomonas sp. SSH11]|uniref:Uncharacterized protein n=1 Tax=Pararoseomonas baculiformis TaxID=2820812 RepID=A0ABS4AG48_9PROT|nr:hypothetical protein [Pararoseomonas baculiformis]MBP0446010.1 hypothetical protein [Pararoseomonas baculiformis]
MTRGLFALALAASVGFAVPQAQANDGIFGNMLSRLARADAPKADAGAVIQERERQARDMRREYWQRERARLAEAQFTREASNRSIAVR